MFSTETIIKGLRLLQQDAQKDAAGSSRKVQSVIKARKAQYVKDSKQVAKMLRDIADYAESGEGRLTERILSGRDSVPGKANTAHWKDHLSRDTGYYRTTTIAEIYSQAREEDLLFEAEREVYGHGSPTSKRVIEKTQHHLDVLAAYTLDTLSTTASSRMKLDDALIADAAARAAAEARKS